MYDTGKTMGLPQIKELQTIVDGDQILDQRHQVKYRLTTD